jgi:hypothetical protein
MALDSLFSPGLLYAIYDMKIGESEQEIGESDFI